ncbi:MAG: preprotein translocase subunit SecA [Planctomycetota bacterium]
MSDRDDRRDTLAKRVRKRWSHARWFQDFLDQVHQRTRVLGGQPDSALQRLERPDRNPTTSQLADAAAVVCVAVKRVLGYQLFDTQIRAGAIMALGGIAEMQTGEGKTLAGILPAYIHGRRGLGVHVASPNAYLARRDFEQVRDVLALGGVTCGHVDDQSNHDQAHQAYQRDVTYAAAHTLGFDYLRDSLAHGQQRQGIAGSRLLRALRGEATHSYRQRRLAVAIVDEADDVLLDDAVSPLILSGSDPQAVPGAPAADSDVLELAGVMAARMQVGRHFQFNDPTGLTLTSAGLDYVYENFEPLDGMRRTWHEYVQTSLRALHTVHRDVDYVVHENRVQLVDASTGRVFRDRSWPRGLQQAVQTKEGIPATPEPITLARMTKQAYFRQYPILAGMTGTADGCDGELASVYGLPISVVPTRLQTKRIVQNTWCCRDIEQKYSEIVTEAISIARQGRAVLIGTLSVEESRALANRLDATGHDFELLNGVQDADEADLVARAGQAHRITVATSLAGRGTDIRLEPAVRRRGGLHVIVAQMHPLARVDRQLIGRGARCGDPGSSRCYTSAEDPLLQDGAPWISNAIRRHCADGPAPATKSIINAIERIRFQRERSQSVRRAASLRAENEAGNLFSQLSERERPAACWAI